MKKIALCILIGTTLNTAFAQDKSSELDPVTITASINPEKASQTGRNLLVIKGERFANLPVHSIDELLRYLPGVEVQSRGPMGSQSDIVIRGGNFQQVLVIVDGLRLNDPNSGHFTSYFPIAPYEIDRIEILKGASSAVYGSEAVGGVIHIITKTFAARSSAALRQSGSEAKEAPSFEKPALNAIVQAAGGEYDFWNLNTGVFFNNGTTSVAAGILSNNTTGQLQRGTRGFVYATTASLSFGTHFSERWELKMRYSYDTRKFAAQNFYSNQPADTADEKINTSWNQMQIAYKGTKHQITLNGGYKDLNDEYQFNPSFAPNKNNSKLTQALFTDEWKLHPKTTITSGAQFIRKKIVSNDRGDHDVNQAAVFAVWNQQFGNYFFVDPSLRLDWNESYGWELIPQANISYRKTKFQLRASGGRTIRDADFTERYNNYNKVFVEKGRIGNPDLVAEHSVSYEVGADYFVTANLKLSASFFQRYHTQLIDYVRTSYDSMPRKVNLTPNGVYDLAKNIAKVNITGAEAEVQYSKQIDAKKQIWTTIGLTWLHSNSSSGVPSLYTSYHAKFLSTFSVIYSANKISASINGLYKKRPEQIPTTAIVGVGPDYFLLNAKLEVFVVKKLLSAFVEADNVFDTSYVDLLGAQMPGRWLMGGIKISLSK